jgi:tRNA (guanosine-2'-O-)-methyltransferase
VESSRDGVFLGAGGLLDSRLMSDEGAFDYSLGGMVLDRRVERLRGVLARRLDALEVVIEDVHDPHNASAIFRNVDAFGATGVTMVYRRAEQPKISKMVSGRIQRWVRTVRRDDPAAVCAELRARGLKVYVTALDETAVSYLDVDWTEPCAVVLGGEREGCSAEMLAAADCLVTIPMFGFAQSLNVSVASAVILGEAARQCEAAGMYAPSWSDEKERIFRDWLFREVPDSPRRKRRAVELGLIPKQTGR